MRNQHVAATLFGIASLVFLSAACSSSSSGTDGGGNDGSSSAACPAFTNLCGKIASAHVNMLCGTTSMSSTPTDMPSTMPSSLPDVASCQYMSPTAVFLERDCFTAAATASSYFMLEKNKKLVGMEMQMDVSGVGDQAFYRTDALTNEGRLYVLKGNLIVISANDNITAGQEAITKTCLNTLAGEILAAK